MMEIASKIVKVQDFLRQKYGEDGYKKLISKILQKTTDIRILSYIANDKNLSAVVRLAAIAAMGENKEKIDGT